jgi:hypothetical protein
VTTVPQGLVISDPPLHNPICHCPLQDRWAPWRGSSSGVRARAASNRGSRGRGANSQASTSTVRQQSQFPPQCSHDVVTGTIAAAAAAAAVEWDTGGPVEEEVEAEFVSNVAAAHRLSPSSGPEPAIDAMPAAPAAPLAKEYARSPSLRHPSAADRGRDTAGAKEGQGRWI